jgi:hypothetical protein
MYINVCNKCFLGVYKDGIDSKECPNIRPEFARILYEHCDLCGSLNPCLFHIAVCLACAVSINPTKDFSSYDITNIDHVDMFDENIQKWLKCKNDEIDSYEWGFIEYVSYEEKYYCEMRVFFNPTK